MRTALSLALSLLLGAAAHAADYRSWTFEVLEVTEIGRNAQTIRLRPDPPGARFPRSCETFVVHSAFDVDGWSQNGRRMVSFEGHREALKLLRQAQALHRIIRFGAIGYGFAAISEESPCEVASRALVVISEEGGAAAVYSVYQEP